MSARPAPDFPFPSGRTKGEGPAAVPVQQPRSSAAGPTIYGERTSEGWRAVLVVDCPRCQRIGQRFTLDGAALRTLAAQCTLLADQFDGKVFE